MGCPICPACSSTLLKSPKGLPFVEALGSLTGTSHVVSTGYLSYTLTTEATSSVFVAPGLNSLELTFAF